MGNIKETYMEETALEVISDAIKEAAMVDRTSEIIHTAFTFLKNNPEVTIAEAVQAGMEYWDIGPVKATRVTIISIEAD